MRYLILSDMHANWDAFEVVLRRSRRKHFDMILVLGAVCRGNVGEIGESCRRLLAAAGEA